MFCYAVSRQFVSPLFLTDTQLTKDMTLKLGYYEKATNFEKISHVFTQYRQNKWEIFYKFLWPFQESWTLKGAKQEIIEFNK